MPKTTKELYEELLAQGAAAQQQADDLLKQYDNRPAFAYDPNTDGTYQALKNQYVHQGRRAMEDTMGQAAGLTGGYNSSYGQSVGNQAYNEYLTQLNAQIPGLAREARSAWDAEGDRMLQRYNLALNAANTAYGRGRDALSDMRYDQEWEQQQRAYNDDLAYRQWQQQQAEDDRDWQRQQAERDRERQERLDEEDRQYRQWQQQYQQTAYDDDLAYRQWQQQQAEADREWQHQQAGLDREWQQQQAGLDRERQERLDEADRQYHEWQMANGDKEDAYSRAMTWIKMGIMPSDEALAAAGIDKAQAQRAVYLANAGGYSGGGGSSGGRRSSRGGRSYSGRSKRSNSKQTPSGNQYTTEEVNDAYAKAKQAILMSGQTGNINYAVDAMDQYADYLTPEMAAELMDMMDRIRKNIADHNRGKDKNTGRSNTNRGKDKNTGRSNTNVGVGGGRWVAEVK